MTPMEPVVPSIAVGAMGRVADDAGDYADVYLRHQDAIVRLAYLLTGDPHRAEDAAAEAFARVWPHWRRGRVRDERSYLRRAVVNELRSRGRRKVVEDREAARRRGSHAPPADHGAADRMALMDALATLPRGQRAVIVLRYYEDLSEADTARLLGMRVGTVKSQSARGLTRLRSALGEEG